jgi:WD40 repeat protein
MTPLDGQARLILNSPGVRALLVSSGMPADGSRLQPVPAAEFSVKDLAQCLVDQAGLDPDHLTALVNVGSPEEFSAALEKAAGQAEDVLFFWYVGHGLVSPANELHLATGATIDLNQGAPEYQALPYSVIRNVVSRCPAKLIVVGLDCCCSGRAEGWTISNGDDPFDIAAQHGLYVLTSAGRDELAWAPPGRYTAFTGMLIRLLTGGDPVAPRLLTLDDVYRSLDRSLSEEGFSRPHRYAADHGDTAPLAANPAYRSGPLRGGFSPYRGLSAYRPEDAPYFFGREDLTRVVVDRLAERRAAESPLVVTGPSGSGKSSLLRAGLIPALQQMQLPVPGQSRPRYLFLTPGGDPLGNLVRHLAVATAGSPRKLRSQVAADPDSFVTMLREARAAYTAKGNLRGLPLVIIVDQFEEIFAPGVGEAERKAFIAALCSAGRTESTGAPLALIVLGVRADFFGHCAGYPDLSPALGRPVIVSPMSEEQLRMAITKPAELADLQIEDGLVDLLLQDLERTGRSADGPGAVLPLLSHALMVTWQNRSGSVLTLAGYRASGGIAGSLAQTADRTLRQLDLDGREIARRLLLGLVHLGDGTEDTRRYVRLSELLPAPDAPEYAATRRVLDLFVHARLLTVDTDKAGIIHEALIRAWPQFRAWIDDSRATLLASERLAQDAAAWEHSGRDRNFLYAGTRLENALAAPKNQPGFTLTPLQQEFLATSTRRARHRIRSARQLIAVLTSLLIIAGAAGGIAFQQRLAADSARNATLSVLVAEEADQLIGTDPSLAMQLSLISYRISPTAEALSSLIGVTASPAATRMLGPAGAEMNTVAFNPGKTILATTSAAGSVQLWSMRRYGHPERLGPPLSTHAAAVTSVAFSADGQLMAAGDTRNTVWLWNVSNPLRPVQLGRVILNPTGLVNSVAFSGRGDILAAASSDGRVSLWDTTGPHRMSPLGPALNAGIGGVNSVAFSPTGQSLAAAGADGYIRLWNITAAKPGTWASEILGSGGKSVNCVAFSPDGSILAAGGNDDNVRLWNISRERRPVPEGMPFTGPASWIYSVSFSPDGKTIAAGSADDKAYLWNLPSGTLLAALPHPGPVLSVTYGHSSDILVTGGADGAARMWTLPGPVVTGFEGSVFTIAFSPDGRYLITASGDRLLRRFDVTSPDRPRQLGPPLTAPGLDGTVAYGPGGRIAAGTGNGAIRLWNAANPNHADALPLPGSALRTAIQYVTFDNSGRLMAAGSSDGEIGLWNVADIAHATPITTWSATSAGPGIDIFAVEFSPDDRLLASAGADGTVRLWDITDLSHPRQIGPPLVKLDSAEYQVAFSPDGRILAASGEDGKVRLWNVADPARPRLLSTLSGPIGIVYDVSFSPDGRYLATANGDKTVALWDITNPAEPRSMPTLTGFSGTVFSAAFSPSGNAIAAGSQDDTVRLWLTNPDSAASYICSTAGDPITRAEWARYIPGAPYDPPCGASG